MENKKIVITGGAGFIGSNIVQKLAKINHCIVIDDLSTGKMSNISAEVEDNGLEFIEGSILDIELLQRTFEGVDYVLHQAAIPSVPRSFENPVACSMVNIIGTLNVLLAARDNRVKKVVYASSSSVYGDTLELPKNERLNPNPLSPYAIAKLAGERNCDVFSRVFRLATVSLRYFNVYGPRQDPNSQYAAVIPRFMKRIINNEPPIIFGDGNQTRDFTFVKDVVEAVVLAAQSDATGVFNIGTGHSVSINDLVVMIMDLAGNKIEPIHLDRRDGEVRHSIADISKASAIGYRPKYSLIDGLRESLEHLINVVG
jgi:UDP-glucose 4-epimerase